MCRNSGIVAIFDDLQNSSQVRENIMKKLSNVECKEVIFSILKEFADFCDSNKLKYYLAYGTLLGAIRHKDFIPWDDDIDVYMPRPDYIRFKTLFKERYSGAKYQLRSDQKNKVDLPFEKVMDMTTIVDTKMNDVDHHLWIDIFPLDGLSSDINTASILQDKASRALKMYSYASAKIGSGTTITKAILKIPVILPFHVLGANHFTSELERMSTSYAYDESKYIGNVVWGAGKKDIFLKSDFDEVDDVEFHGAKFHAMRDWNGYLKKVYGDYMRLPPENARIGHCFDAYDLTVGEQT